MAANPFLYINYKFNYAWRFSFHANYKESYGSITDLYPAAYRTDYRNYRMNNGILPVYRNQSYSLYGEYKSTVREFFPPCRSTITGDGPTVSSNSRSATGKSRLSPTACPTILPAGR